MTALGWIERISAAARDHHHLLSTSTTKSCVRDCRPALSRRLRGMQILLQKPPQALRVCKRRCKSLAALKPQAPCVIQNVP